MISRYTRAFTLIELLVVVSIISMLSSVILVALQGARDKGRIGSLVTFATYNYHKLGADLVFYANFNEASGAPLDTAQNFTSAISVGRAASFSSGTAFDSANQDPASTLAFTRSSSLTVANNSYSFSLWAKRSNAAVSGYEDLLVLDSDNGRQIYQNSGNTVCWQSTGPSVPNSSVNDDKWHHILCTFDKSTGVYTFYLDGKKVSTATITNNVFTFQNLRIGNGFSAPGVSYRFNGLIDEVQIFSEILLAYQVQELYALGRTSHPLAVQ